MDFLTHNRTAWDKQVSEGNRWTVPVGTEEVASARGGKLRLLLTPQKYVPAEWLPALETLPTLCLACGGGQQAPLLAAAGAVVTVLDNSPKQLEQDRFVANREGLELTTVQGDMADLSQFPDASFGLIFHPCSNCFVPDVLPVWRECFRVLRSGGILLAGFCNPVRFSVEDSRKLNGVLTIQYKVPTSDIADWSASEFQQRFIEQNEVLEFGHTLEDQIGGQLSAGFVLTGFYEDRFDDVSADPISNFIDTFIATRAVKP